MGQHLITVTVPSKLNFLEKHNFNRVQLFLQAMLSLKHYYIIINE